MSFRLTSTAFREGEAIPTEYTGDGTDISPPLAWTDPPAGVVSFALVCDDPDAPRKTWVHWVIWNIPADQRTLDPGTPKSETIREGVVQGTTDFGDVGYGGPAPPPGKPHRYYFKLYALDALLTLRPGATKAQVLEAMKGHVLGETSLMGTYQRKGSSRT